MKHPRQTGAPQKAGEDQLTVIQTATTPVDVVAEIVMTAPGSLGEEEEIPAPRNREERRALASFLRKQKKYQR